MQEVLYRIPIRLACYARILACNFFRLGLESPRFRFQACLQSFKTALFSSPAGIQRGEPAPVITESAGLVFQVVATYLIVDATESGDLAKGILRADRERIPNLLRGVKNHGRTISI